MTSTLEIRSFGDGPPVVFLHGTPTTVDLFDGIARRVASTRRALVVSLPGYGKSAPLRSPWTLADLYDVLADALDREGARGAWLVGFSAGGYHALALATDRRLRAAGVVALAGMLGVSDDERGQMRGLADALASGADLRAIAGPRFLSEAFRAEHPGAVAKVEAWLGATSAANLAAEIRAVTDGPDLTERVAALDVPIVARVGSLDVATPPDKSRAIVKAAKRGVLQLVAGVGHALPYEDADATAAAVLAAVTAG